MSKENGRIINEIMFLAADVMEAKIGYLEMVAKQFADKGDQERADHWRADISSIKAAIELIRRFSGCWA